MEEGHYRALLLKKFMELRLSESTQRLIAEQFAGRSQNEKEKLAELFVNMFLECETENDVVNVLYWRTNGEIR